MKKNIYKKIYKISVVCLICICLLSVCAKNICGHTSAEAIVNAAIEGDDEYVKDRVLRLHVIANSDSAADQLIKMQIKDAITAEYADIFLYADNRNECINIINERKSEIINKVNAILAERGFNYECSITICKDIFPDKYYGDLLFKEGEYTALKIALGKAEGKNWWCVLYPPLCFLDVKSDEESVAYSKKNDGKVQIRSRIVEWWDSVN